MIRPRRNGRRNPVPGPPVGKADVDNPQLVAAAVDAAELLLDLSLDPELDFSPALDFSPEPESVEEEPLLELDGFLPDSRLSVR